LSTDDAKAVLDALKAGASAELGAKRVQALLVLILTKLSDDVTVTVFRMVGAVRRVGR
jgi:hypothetical protein